jgi:hypothetical protein
MSEVNIRKLMSVLLEKDSLTADPEVLRIALNLSEEEMKIIIPEYKPPVLESRNIEEEFILRKVRKLSKDPKYLINSGDDDLRQYAKSLTNSSDEDSLNPTTIEETKPQGYRKPIKCTGHLTPYSDTQYHAPNGEIIEPQMGELRPSKSFFREQNYIKPRVSNYTDDEIEEMIRCGRIKDRLYAKVLLGNMSYKNYLKDNPELLKSQRILSIGRKTLEFYNRKCTPQEYFYEGISFICHSEYHRKGNQFLYPIEYYNLEIDETYIARIINAQIQYTKHINRDIKDYNILKDDSFFRKFKFSLLKQYIPSGREIARFNMYKCIISISKDTKFIGALERLEMNLEKDYKNSEECVIVNWFMNNLRVHLDEISDINGLFIEKLPKATMGDLYDKYYKEKSNLKKANRLINNLYECLLETSDSEINKSRISELSSMASTLLNLKIPRGTQEVLSLLQDFTQELHNKIYKENKENEE